MKIRCFFSAAEDEKKTSSSLFKKRCLSAKEEVEGCQSHTYCLISNGICFCGERRNWVGHVAIDVQERGEEQEESRSIDLPQSDLNSAAKNLKVEVFNEKTRFHEIHFIFYSFLSLPLARLRSSDAKDAAWSPSASRSRAKQSKSFQSQLIDRSKYVTNGIAAVEISHRKGKLRIKWRLKN
jgi:hypothetical protein